MKLLWTTKNQEFFMKKYFASCNRWDQTYYFDSERCLDHTIFKSFFSVDKEGKEKFTMIMTTSFFPSAQKLMKAACKKINLLNVYCKRIYTQKKNILFSFSSTKKVVVKNVQHSIFANPFFIHFYFFFIYNQTSSNTFFSS